MQEVIYDVAVIGAGPAGAQAAVSAVTKCGTCWFSTLAK